MSTFTSTQDFKKPRAGGGSPLGFVGAIGIRRVTEALRGRFTVLRQLQGSESAEVYLARSITDDNRIVRIKVLSPRAACDAKRRNLFHMEAIAAATLKHSSITRSFEAVDLDGIHLYIVEHRPWTESLRSLLNRKGWLTLEQAARIFNQIASAIDYAHRASVLHLRLTPDSILIEPNGHVQVTDFGIGTGSELAWAHTERSRGLAAQYCSVEQGIGARLDHRSDIYSLGLLLYEMLTDRVPFESCDAEGMARKRATQPPLPAHVLSTGVPPTVSRILMQLLERDPDRRPATASCVQAALSQEMATTIQAGKGR